VLKKLVEETIIKLLSTDDSISTQDADPTMAFYQSMVGKYVIVRDRNEGINFGKLHTVCKDGVILEDAQRIFRIVSNDKKLSWYEGVAKSGLCPENSKISGKVEKKLIIAENFSITLVSESASEQILGVAPNATTL